MSPNAAGNSSAPEPREDDLIARWRRLISVYGGIVQSEALRVVFPIGIDEGGGLNYYCVPFGTKASAANLRAIQQRLDYLGSLTKTA